MVVEEEEEEEEGEEEEDNKEGYKDWTYQHTVTGIVPL